MLAADTDPDVENLIKGLAHPLVPLLRELRACILAADSRIAEGIKWNSPSFRTTTPAGDWFATINAVGGGLPPRPNDPPALRLVLHAGAKAKGRSLRDVPDPSGMLSWASPDRAVVSIRASDDHAAALAALAPIIAAWARRVS